MEGPLKKHTDSLGLDSQVYEALRTGDLQALIWSMLSEEQDSDPLLGTVMQFILMQSHAMSPGTRRRDEAAGPPGSPHGSSDDVVIGSSDNGQSSALRAALGHVAGMLGACSACCGEERSCPKCHGGGKPGCAPSIASAEELRAWLEPALWRMGMHITSPPLPEAAPRHRT